MTKKVVRKFKGNSCPSEGLTHSCATLTGTTFTYSHISTFSVAHKEYYFKAKYRFCFLGIFAARISLLNSFEIGKKFTWLNRARLATLESILHWIYFIVFSVDLRFKKKLMTVWTESFENRNADVIPVRCQVICCKWFGFGDIWQWLSQLFFVFLD